MSSERKGDIFYQVEFHPADGALARVEQAFRSLGVRSWTAQFRFDSELGSLGFGANAENPYQGTKQIGPRLEKFLYSRSSTHSAAPIDVFDRGQTGSPAEPMVTISTFILPTGLTHPRYDFSPVYEKVRR